ncbi:MAG: hypothetical protein CMI12_09210 [Oceanospirillum sp.]|nr:hypothetical protein [Oceanospirillum sp.]
MVRKRIKARQPKQGYSVKALDVPNYDNSPPVFSLERVQQGNYCFSSLDQTHKAQFAEAIFRRRGITWREIKSVDRHSLGFEKIARSGIKAPIPAFITEDEESFLAFRYNGMSPMVGYRVRDVFYVLWFDHNFTLYKH